MRLWSLHPKYLDTKGLVALFQVTDSQLKFELSHLGNKLKKRDPKKFQSIEGITATPESHPLFEIIKGTIADWERF